MKEKMTQFFDKISPQFEKLAQSKYLTAISGAMMGTLGPVILGSMSLLLMVLPIPGLSGLVTNLGIAPVLGAVFTFTTNSIAVYIAFLVGTNIVKQFIPEDPGLSAGVISLMGFFILTPLGASEAGTYLSFDWLGAQGVFTAILVGIVTGRVYVYIKQKGWVIKMPASVPPMVSRTFESLIPTFVLGIIFIATGTIFSHTSAGSLHQAIYTIIQVPLQNVGGSVGGLIIFSVVQQLLWFFGIHGTNVVLPLMSPILSALDNANMATVMAGGVPTNLIGMAFFNIVTFGGLALGLIMLMIRSKSKQYRELGKLAVVPALFGITEPVIFGLPLVLNFDLFFPFVFNNSIAIIIVWAITKIGILPTMMGSATIFGLPLGLHASTQGSVSIIIMQLVVQLVLSPILWYPWFKRVERKAVAEEALAANE